MAIFVSAHGLTGSIYGFCPTQYIIDLLVASVRTSPQPNVGKSGMYGLMKCDKVFYSESKAGQGFSWTSGTSAAKYDRVSQYLPLVYARSCS